MKRISPDLFSFIHPLLMRRMGHVFFGVTLFVLFLPFQGIAQNTTIFSLDEAVDYALKNANSIKVANGNIQDAEFQIKQLTATGLPNVGAELGYQFFFVKPSTLLPDFISPAVYGVLSKETVRNSSTGQNIQPLTSFGPPQEVSFVQRHSITPKLSVSQLLFSGSYLVALKAASLSRQYQAVALTAKQSEVRYQVIDAYLPPLLLSESLKTIDNNLKNLEKLISETRALNKVGFVEALDVDRLDLSIANLRTERENLARQRDVLVNVLKLVMGYPLDNTLEVKDNLDALLLTGVDLNEPLDFKSKAEYRTLDMGIQLNELNVKLNQAARLPTVAAFASYSESYNGDDFFKLTRLPSGIVGLTASYSIWDNHEKEMKIKRAQLAVQQLRYQQSDLERALTLQVLNARINVQNTQQRVKSQEKNLALAERIYKTTQIKYKEGIGNSFEMTSTEQQLYSAQSNLRQAKYDLMVAQRGLLKALGK
jgi:outer membrane protein